MRTALALCIVALLCSGCEKAMRDMYDQPRYKPLGPGALWPDGRASREAVPGTVVHSGGTIAGTSSGRLEMRAVAPDVPALPRDEKGRVRGPLSQQPNALSDLHNPLPVTPARLARGQERFNIYCAPCHSPAGDGDGMVVRRGFPAPPSYHSERLRNAPDAHFYAVITNGYGAMYSYADRVTPDDRWAIVEYIRALQRSQNARLDDVPTEKREQLEAGR
jgi:mono/diheme cytochrome c family protein